MLQSTIFLLAMFLLVSITGCDNPDSSSAANNPASNSPAVEESASAAPDNRTPGEIVEAAIVLQEKASQLGHAWRTTANHIAAAQQHLQTGGLEQAHQTALRAELTARASIDQAHSEQDAWQDRFPK